MGKRKTPKVKDLKASAKSITADELTELQTLVQKLDNGHMQLGKLDSSKHQILHALAGVKDEVKLLQTKLEDKYGNVDINIKDGSIKNTTNGQVNP